MLFAQREASIIIYCCGLLSPVSQHQKKKKAGEALLIRRFEKRIKLQLRNVYVDISPSLLPLCLVISCLAFGFWVSQLKWKTFYCVKRTSSVTIRTFSFPLPRCIGEDNQTKLPFSAFSRSDRNWVRHCHSLKI